MALASNALTTLAAAKGELGISNTSSDSVLERQINAASQAIELFCEREFGRATITDEPVKGYGGVRLLLARTPIVSVSGITIDGETVDPASYSIENAKAGILFAPNGWEWTARLQPSVSDPFLRAGTEEGKYLVTYVAGYLLPADASRDLPYDIEEACLMTVVNLFRARGKFNHVTSETAVSGSNDWAGIDIPGPARAILQRYRRVA